MKNQLQLSQIQEALARDKNYYEVFMDISELEDIYKDISSTQLLEYVPVKIVACFEEFFRGMYKEIIDNPKSRNRLKEVDALKNAKFDYEIISAFQENEITIGDYLSYLIPCSKLEDINNALSKLLSIDFLAKVEEVDKRRTTLLKSINDIFRLRHIFCHELPLNVELSHVQVQKLIADSCQFLDFSDSVIKRSLYGDVSIPYEEIKKSQVKFEAADKELNELVALIKSKEDKNNLFYNNLSYIEEWRIYRDARAKSESSIHHSGQYFEIYYNLSSERTTRNLIKELKREFKDELRKNSLLLYG